MNKGIYLFLIYIPILCFGYSKQDIKYNKQNYSRYIRPQVKNIIRDYKQALIKIFPAQTKLSELFDSMIILDRKIIESNKLCTKGSNTTCLSFMENTLNLLVEIKNKTDRHEYLALKKTLAQAIIYIGKMHKEISIHDLSKLTMYLNRIYLQFFNSLFQTSLVNNEKLSLVHFNFFKPLIKGVSIKNDDKFFYSHTGRLNYAWNEFNSKFNEVTTQMSKDLLQRFDIIHKRWRSILKIVLIKP
ncbi:MAG: hypothetical protein N4A33_06555 [Bacteriovoracaceae bacterium]|jgi:hypothetical protein|nr:hypothetical protein [Bacteriovoracaceae bacterium]